MTPKKTALLVLSIVSVAGIGYFVYSKLKIAKLNKKVASLSEVENMISNIDVTEEDIPADVSDEPFLPEPSDDFSSDNPSGTDGIDNYGDFESMILTTIVRANLRSDASTTSRIIYTFDPGEVFFIDSKKTVGGYTWYKVNDGDRYSGWFREDVVTLD